MIPTSTPAPSLWYRESRAIVQLAAPFAPTQLACMAITTTDVVMMGWIAGDVPAHGAHRRLDAGRPCGGDAVLRRRHVADALQIAARGVLQGLKDTRVPMLFTLATSRGWGLPAAALLGIGMDLGGEGVRTGIAAAMIGACVLLIRRFRAQARGLAARAS